ncbi:MAG: hypothetical protein JO249_00365, partial [Acidobacteria bacterium]|nr:hypothetical protein [Acidobacteriota bacterium]
GKAAFDQTRADVTVLNADGSRTETVTDFNQDSSLKDETVTTTSANGLSITTRRDTTGQSNASGEAIFDQAQSKATNADGSVVTTVMDVNPDGSLNDETVTTTSANGLSITTQRDTTGLLDTTGKPIFDQTRTDLTILNADGSRTETVTDLNHDGSLRDETVRTTSANGLAIATKWDTTGLLDATGKASFDQTRADVTVLNADGSRTETVTDSRTKEVTVAITSADGNTVSTKRDLIRSKQLASTQIDAYGNKVTTVMDVSSGNALTDEAVTTTSANGLSITTERDTTGQLDANGNAIFDQSRTDDTVLNSDGSRTETITDYSAGRAKDETVITTSANGLIKTTKWDLSGTGNFSEIQIDQTSIDPAGNSTETITNEDGSGALKSKYVQSISPRLITTKQWDTTGAAGGFDQTSTDRTIINADGSRSEYVTNSNGSGSITTISADGLFETTKSYTASGTLNQIKTVVTSKHADGSQTKTVTDFKADGYSVEDREVTTTSADARNVTITRDINGDGTFDQAETKVIRVDGSTTTTITDLGANGVLKDRSYVTTSADGLATATQWDLDGSGTIDRTRSDVIVANSDGSRTETIIDTSSDGTLHQKGVLTTSADGRSKTLLEDTTGAGFSNRKEATTINADGSSVTLTEDVTASNAVVDDSMTTVSADGLSKTVLTDTKGVNALKALTDTQDFNTYDEKAVTQRNIDGSVVTKEYEYNPGGSVRSWSLTTVSADGLTETIQTDSTNSDRFDEVETIVTAIDGSTSSTLVASNADGSTKYEINSYANALASSTAVQASVGQYSYSQIALTGSGNSVDPEFIGAQITSFRITGNYDTLANATLSAISVPINGTGNEVSISGGHDDVQVNGDRNTLTVSGSNNQLQVTGDGNWLTIDAGNVLEVKSGDGNILANGNIESWWLGGSGSTLISDGGANTLDYSYSATFVDRSAQSCLAVADSYLLPIDLNDSSKLIGIRKVEVSGSHDVVLSSAVSPDVLMTNGVGSSDTLIARGAGNTLIASDRGSDTLIGNEDGNTLIASAVSGATAFYAGSGMKISSGQAIASGMIGDVLIGVASVEIVGNNNTLIGGGAIETLDAIGTGNTLIAGPGKTIVILPNADISISAISSSIYSITNRQDLNGYSVPIGDTLLGSAVIEAASVVTAASDLTMVGATLSTSGDNDTLVSVGSFDRVDVTATGKDDTLINFDAGDLSASGNNDVLLSTLASDVTLSTSGRNDTIVASGATNSLIASASNDTLMASGLSSVLIADAVSDILMASGSCDTLVASARNDALVDAGLYDTLIALGNGNTLSGGSGNSATLIAFASGNLLEGGSGNSTLLHIAGVTGNTLMAGTGVAVAYYSDSNFFVDLTSGIASLKGASSSDTLIGITSATVAGDNDTLTSATANCVLTAAGDDDVLVTNGTHSTLAAFGKHDVLYGYGNGDIVEGFGSGATLIGSCTGNTLLAAGAAVLYAGNDLAVDLTAGVAINGGTPGISDDLVGVSALAVSGNNNTLIGGSSSSSTLSVLGSGNTLIGGGAKTTLVSNGIGNRLQGGAGQTEACYIGDGVEVDLRSGIARSVATPGTNDVLVDINLVSLKGNSDIARAAASGDTLMLYGGSDNTLIGSSEGGDTLIDFGGSDNTLDPGAGPNSTLIGGTGDKYLFKAGYGQDVIWDTGGQLVFGPGLGSGNLWFIRHGTDLVIQIIGTTSSVTINNWFAGDYDATIVGGDGAHIEFPAVTALTAAMAEYSAANPTFDPTTASKIPYDVTLQGALQQGWTPASFVGVRTLIGSDGITTLESNPGGNTLLAGSNRTKAYYAADDVVVQIGSNGADTATGPSGVDQLKGIYDVLVSGNGDTLIASPYGSDTLEGGKGSTTLVSNLGVIPGAASNTLIAGAGPTVASYNASWITVDLSSGIAKSSNGGAFSYDALYAFNIAEATGIYETLIGNKGTSTLMSNGARNFLYAESSSTVAYYEDNYMLVDLMAGEAYNIQTGNSLRGDILFGFSSATVAGNYSTLTSLRGNLLEATGNYDTIAGAALTMVAAGTGDVLIDQGYHNKLFGNGNGNILDGSGAFSPEAIYAGDDLAIDLGAGTGRAGSAGIHDTLVGIQIVAVSGSDNTLIGAGLVATLINSSGQ